MNTHGKLLLDIEEHARTRLPLIETKAYEGVRVLGLPPFRRRSGPIHVPQQPAADALAVQVMLWGKRNVSGFEWVHFGVEVRAADVDQGYLNPLV